MTSLALTVFEAMPLSMQRRANKLARSKRWSSMALDPSGCREGYSLQDGEPFFSAAFLKETAPASAATDLAEESFAALSRILASPVWDRVVGYDSSSADTSSDWLTYITSSSADTTCVWLSHFTSGLCYAASVLELHPAVRQHSHMGSSTPGGGCAAGGVIPAPSSGYDGVDLSATVQAPPPSAGCPADPAIRVPSSSQWQEARHNIAEALRLLSTHDSQQVALVRVLSVALGHMREVLSSIASHQTAAVGGDCLVGAGAGGQNRSGGGGLGMRDRECVQLELLLGLPEELWGVHPCCNTACVRLKGSCEMEIKTRACGGGCGARYCCTACQEQAWRGGHRRNCAAMRETRGRFETTNNESHLVYVGQ